MAPETLGPSPFPPPSSEPSFPPASSLPPRKPGLRSAARCPLARVSPRSSVSPMLVPSVSPQEDSSIPLRIPLLPSSASVPGGCSSGQASLPPRAESCSPDGFPCLDESVLGVDLGVFDGEGAGLPVGAQIGVRYGIRSSPVKGDEPCVANAVNSQQVGPPHSLVLDFPT